MHATKVNTAWFRSALADRQLSQRGLAARMHIEPSAINLMLHGRRKMQINEAAEISRHLEMPLKDVLENAGLRMPDSGLGEGERVAIIGTIGVDYSLTTGRVSGPRSADSPIKGASGITAIRCEANGIFDGAVFYVRSTKSAVSEFLGKLAIVTMEDGARLLRIVKPGSRRGVYSLATTDGLVTHTDVMIAGASAVLWTRFAG